MDAVASVYRLAASLSPEPTGNVPGWTFTAGAGSTPSSPGTMGAASAWGAKDWLALRRRSLYDQLRAIAEYGPAHRLQSVVPPH